MTAIHKEVTFEGEIVGHMTTAGGWLEGDSKKYDRKLSLYPEDVIGWIQDTQPAEYEKIKSAQNGATDTIILERLAKAIQEEGPLAVLRQGFKRVNARFSMCAFKPGHGLNPDTLEKYSKVRCRVVRQVRYSENNEKSIDLVLFVNGIPVATVELKTDFTQSIHDATKQYQFDRLPKDAKTGRAEPLLTFNRGALVHFAASTDEVRMTTFLDGPKTVYLPFNLGNNGAAGNPPNIVEDNHRTAYLWERVFQRDAWLEILEKFIHLEKSSKIVAGKKINSERIIFPRYHQWDVVRNLIATAKAEGAGKKYLVQHSAGSGKSNTIMWLAHQLSSTHDASDKKIFDSIIVVTDRQVLDDQLQATISQFEHKDGVVKRITKDGSKSAQLGDALKNKTPIIIVTIQTFPFALETIGDLKDIAQRSFAVIADEAHSSQTGEAAKKLREALGITDTPKGEEGEAVSAEEALVAQMNKRASSKNISYFAFTATPKPKTMELFGRVGPDGKPVPFHVYSMQQAIEEGFILDVLQNYTTYEIAYKLATITDKAGDVVVPTGEAAQVIKKYAKLHPYNIEQKVEIIVEHFRETVQPLLGGRAKAMVVCDSRKAAVRYKVAIDKYIAAKGYGLATLVAFSGEVTDEVAGIKETYTETGMNNLKGESIPEAFAGNSYQVLLVAEKFQTGFDQPLLVAMYVDKKLANIAAVQTLSRLNRTYERDGVKKEATYVLDFVNKADDILKAFIPYYRVAQLSGVTDPDIIHDLQNKLDKANIYTNDDVDRYFAALTKAQEAKQGDKSQGLLKAALDPIVDRYRAWVEKAKQDGDTESIERAEIFKKNVAEFVRAYGFLSQIYNYGDTDLEKRSLFFAGLTRLLKDDQDDNEIDLSDVQMTHYKKTIGFSGHISLMTGTTVDLEPMTSIGTAKAWQKKYGPLAEVIKIMNEILGAGIDDEHQVVFLAATAQKLTEVESLRDQARNNSREQFKNAGEVESLGEELLVHAKDELADKNERQNAAIQESLTRLFSNREGLSRLMDGFADYVYDFHNRPAQS
jgi:type I restriction enzyme R subunit